jgi:hypothetical protein
MKVIIEGKQEEFDISGKEVTLKQILNEVERFLHEVGRISTSLKINDIDIPPEDIKKKEEELIPQETTLEFKAVDLLSYIAEQLLFCKKDHSILIELIKSINQENSEENKTQEKIIIYLHGFLELWSQIISMIPLYIEEITPKEECLSSLLQNCYEKIPEVVKALESKDKLLFSDIIFYDLLPILEKIINFSEKLYSKLTDNQIK